MHERIALFLFKQILKSAAASIGKKNRNKKIAAVMAGSGKRVGCGGIVMNGIRNRCAGDIAGEGVLGRLAKSGLILLCLALLPACSINPVQSQVTGIKTEQIVLFIRCETRLAIQDKAISLLRQYQEGKHEPSQKLADLLNSQRGAAWDISAGMLMTKDERDFYFRYIKTGIAYDFTFDITEENRATVLADPVRLITNGTVGIGLDGVGDFARNNTRRFIMSDTFDNLLHNHSFTCGDRSPNFAYPIAGSIGISELISTFVDLNEGKNLVALDAGNSRVFADTRTFTTTLTGSVTPHIEIAPFGNGFGLASPSSLQAFAQRLDKHMVIIGLSMDTSKGGAGGQLAVVPVAAVVGGRSALQKSGRISPAEQGALDAARQAQLDAYLDRASR